MAQGQLQCQFCCHPEPGPELDSGSTISGSHEMLKQACPEDSEPLLKQVQHKVQNDTFRVHDILIAGLRFYFTDSVY